MGNLKDHITLRSLKKKSQDGVAQWMECWPVNGKVSGLIPGQGTCLGCGSGPQMGGGV